jgi:hypothetical protein
MTWAAHPHTTIHIHKQGEDLLGRGGLEELSFYLDPDGPSYILTQRERLASFAPHLPLPPPPHVSASQAAFLPLRVPLPHPLGRGARCCEGEGPCEVFMAVAIASRAQGGERRRAVRDTWLARAYASEWGPRVRHVFVVGVEGPMGRVSKAVLAEAREHGDVAVVNVTDVVDAGPEAACEYAKGLGGLLWGAGECGAWVVLAAQDDAYVDLPPLLARLQGLGPRRLYAGRLLRNLTTPEALRGAYPYPQLPPFASAGAVVLSRAVVEALAPALAHPRRPRLPFDVAIGVAVEQMAPSASLEDLTGGGGEGEGAALLALQVGAAEMRAMHEGAATGVYS